MKRVLPIQFYIKWSLGSCKSCNLQKCVQFFFKWRLYGFYGFALKNIFSLDHSFQLAKIFVTGQRPAARNFTTLVTLLLHGLQRCLQIQIENHTFSAFILAGVGFGSKMIDFPLLVLSGGCSIIYINNIFRTQVLVGGVQDNLKRDCFLFLTLEWEFPILKTVAYTLFFQTGKIYQPMSTLH